MALGLLLGLLAPLLQRQVHFPPDFHQYIFLPPIVFESAYSMDRTAFFRNIGV